MSRYLVILSLGLATVITFVRSDEYLNESEGFCKKSRDVVSCGKFTLLKYIDKASMDHVLMTNTSSIVQLVKINNPDDEQSFFPEARKLPGTDELTRFIKFVQTRVDRFLKTQGIAVPLPKGFMVIEEGSPAIDQARGHRKKKGVISLLTLLGVFKLKLLVGLALLGIFFIKKVILLSALILPSILHNLKMSCKHIIPHHVGHSEEYHDDSIYGNYGHSGYSKEWERRYKNPHAGLPTQDDQNSQYYLKYDYFTSENAMKTQHNNQNIPS